MNTSDQSKNSQKIQKNSMIDMITKIKIDEKTAWKNRRIIMISTASINQINCIKYQNKMNIVFKKINIYNVLIVATSMLKIKIFIIFTMIKKKTSQINWLNIKLHEKKIFNFQSFILIKHDENFWYMKLKRSFSKIRLTWNCFKMKLKHLIKT